MPSLKKVHIVAIMREGVMQCVSDAGSQIRLQPSYHTSHARLCVKTASYTLS